MSANQQVLAGLGGGVPVGQYLFTAALDNNAWVVPANVASISVVCVGPGAHTNMPGYGGCLRYVNNIAVTPGETLYIDNRENGGRTVAAAAVEVEVAQLSRHSVVVVVAVLVCLG